MRIEEISTGNYVKSPDKAEKELINVVNRFFNSDMEGFEKSKESIILETQRRLKPLIINLVKKIAWEEGYQIFEPLIQDLIKEVIESEIGNIKDLIAEIKGNSIKYTEFSFKITDNTTSSVELPADSKIAPSYGALKVNVNGMKQLEDINYTISLKDKFIASIVFDDTLDIDDVVDIEFWSYSDDTAGGTL